MCHRVRDLTIVADLEATCMRTRNGERGTRNTKVDFVPKELALLFRVPTSAFRVSGLL